MSNWTARCNSGVTHEQAQVLNKVLVESQYCLAAKTKIATLVEVSVALLAIMLVVVAVCPMQTVIARPSNCC
jgi:hypothetical protein